MKKLLILMLAIILVLPLINASLGTFKQNDCIMIRVLANCSAVNLTEVSNNNITYVINSPMTNLGGQTFNYSFCNTSLISTYSYSWDNPCVDCSENNCGNDFEITFTGEKVSLSNIIIVIVFLALIILFFILGYSFEKEKWILKTSFYILSLILGLLALNSARIIASESSGLLKMGTSGIILMISMILFFFLYIFIYWTINTFKSIKQKKDSRWDY